MGKIGTLEMYDEFRGNTVENKNVLKELIINYNKSKDYYYEKLKDYKHYILNFTNLDYDSLYDLKTPIPDTAIKSLVNFAGLNINYLGVLINNIVEINKEISKAEKELEIYKQVKIKQKIFTEIIYKFNTKISDEILNTGYVYKPGYGLGRFRIKKVLCDKRIKKRIDWGKSKIEKQRLIDAGILPYKVLARNEDNTIKEDNGGVHWFVYFIVDVDYLWNWVKTAATALNVPYYKFRPTLYNNVVNGGKKGNINKLKEMVFANDERLLNFTT